MSLKPTVITDKEKTKNGEEYVNIISKISTYKTPLSDEDYKNISKDFRDASFISLKGLDDLYFNITFDVVKKAYYCRVISVGYVDFIERYIESVIKFYPDRVQEIRPLLDFINENMRNSDFKWLEFYRKELERLIYNKIEGFHFVLTTDAIREKMFYFLKPEYRSRYDLNVVNINWTTGVYDKQSGIFLTLIYYVSDGLARCGIHYRSYIVITDNGHIFKVDNNDEYEKHRYNFRIPKEYSYLTDKVKEAIEFYDGAGFKYRKNLDDETKEKLKNIRDVMDNRCHRSFSIHSESDAKRLFEKENCNVYAIKNLYNKETISNFEKFSIDEKISHWRGEKYLELLKDISDNYLHFDTDGESCKKFNTACYFFSEGVDKAYERKFLKAVKFMYQSDIMKQHEEIQLRTYIIKYTERYPDNLKNIKPLIEFVKANVKTEPLRSFIKDFNI